jgi:hypothetical protein
MVSPLMVQTTINFSAIAYSLAASVGCLDLIFFSPDPLGHI